jgi:hypothetical protein
MMRDLATRFVAEQSKEVSEYFVDKDVKPIKEENVGQVSGNVLAISTEAPASLGLTAPPVVILPGPFKPRHRFKVLQQFEGTVLEISGDECRAHIRDLTRPGFVEEITFSIEEISESDRELAVLGAVFYWDIGYQDRIDGQRLRVSAIRFRRIPMWKEKDLVSSRREAESLSESLGWKR